MIESGGSPERNESLFDNEEHRELQAEPTHETDSGQLDAKQGNPPEPSQDNRAEEPGAVSGSLLTPQGPGEPHPGNTGGCDSATWGKAPPVRSADGRLTSQESGVDAFGASGLLVSTLSSYSASEPATRTNSLGAFEFGGLGARARELPSVSEADTRPELEWKALSEQKSLASMSEAGAITEVGGGNLGVEAKTLFDVLAGESKATPLMVAGWRSAAEPVTVCSASCQTEGSFEPTKHYSAGNDPARIAVSGTSNPQVADTGCQASVPSEDQSRPEAFQRKEFLVWAWNPVAVPPSPTGTPERTPQGSFDLPVRVNRVESMLPGSVNGTGTETGAGSGSGSGEVAEAEPRALSKTVVPAWEGTNGMSGLASENFEVPGSGKRFLPVEGRAERPSAESMNPIPVESASAPYGSGVTSGAIQNTPEEECRSEAASFDLPVRVGRLESILGGVSGDQRQETHGGRSPSASFDLPVRVSRPERMLAGYFPSGQKADLNSAEFRSESMLPAEGSGSGIEAVDGPGQITGEVSEKTRLGGNTSGEVTGPEEYWRALVELPALMFEAALFKRQLAELRRQHDVTDRGSKSSPNESQQRKIPNGTEAVLTEREATHRAAVGKLEADLEEETQKRQALEIKRVEAEKDRLALKSEKAVSELVQSAIVAGAKETVVELRGELAATEARAAGE